MIRITTLEERLTSEAPESKEEDGCWKKPMTPRVQDWMGNSQPAFDTPTRRYYHEDGAPAAELEGEENLW